VDAKTGTERMVRGGSNCQMEESGRSGTPGRDAVADPSRFLRACVPGTACAHAKDATSDPDAGASTSRRESGHAYGVMRRGIRKHVLTIIDQFDTPSVLIHTSELVLARDVLRQRPCASADPTRCAHAHHTASRGPCHCIRRGRQVQKFIEEPILQKFISDRSALFKFTHPRPHFPRPV